MTTGSDEASILVESSARIESLRISFPLDECYEQQNHGKIMKKQNKKGVNVG